MHHAILVLSMAVAIAAGILSGRATFDRFTQRGQSAYIAWIGGILAFAAMTILTCALALFLIGMAAVVIAG